MSYSGGAVYIANGLSVQRLNPGTGWDTPQAGNGHPGRPVLGRIATATPAGLLGVAVDAAGNMLFADLQANRILVVPVGTGTFYGQAMIAGHVYDIAGTGSRGHHGEDGPATGATLAGPQSVTVDAAGNVLIADTHNQRVRVVAGQTGTFYGVPMTAGDIDTVAGTGVAEFSGNGGPATSADIGEPGGIMVSPAGDLIFCDAYNDQIREVAG